METNSPTFRIKVVRPFAVSCDFLSKQGITSIYGADFASWLYNRAELTDIDVIALNTVVETHDYFIDFIKKHSVQPDIHQNLIF